MRERLLSTLAAAGVPVASCPAVVGPDVVLTLADNATDAQHATAAAILASFDWSAAADAAWILGNSRNKALNDITQGQAPVHIGARAGDAAVWTFGINNLLEYFTARLALAAGGNWTPTADQAAAAIATARQSYAVDPQAPDPATIAGLLSAGRMNEATIVGLTQAVVESGGGDPI